jgi:hypothetical protein
MFFGELYMNIRIVKAGIAQPLDVLGLGVAEMMQKLVKDPTHENVKCVFQVAKVNRNKIYYLNKCSSFDFDILKLMIFFVFFFSSLDGKSKMLVVRN